MKRIISGIYKIYNTVNKKIYIGRSANLKEREYKHFRNLRFNKHVNKYLQNDYNKYGRDKFQFVIIETTYNVNTLSIKETHWINFYKCHNREFGYNIGTSHVKNFYGSGSPRARSILQFDMNNKFIKKWGSISEAERGLSINASHISGCCKGKHKTSGGYIWKYENEKISNKPKKEKKKKRYQSILQYDLNGKFIREWQSVSLAGKKLQIYNSSIHKCCRNKQETAGSYMWRFKNKGELINRLIEVAKNTTRAVIQISLDYEILKAWKSVKEAAQHFNVNIETIYACCRGDGKTAAKYIWRYKDDEINIEKIKQESDGYILSNMKIAQYNIKTMKIIKIWKNSKEIQNILNIYNTNIIACCKGKTNTSHGYIWKYYKPIGKYKKYNINGV